VGKKGKGFRLEKGSPMKQKRKGTARKNNYRTTYNSKDMARAVAQVKKQKMSIREAALEYGVKRSTLHDIVRGKVAEEVGRPNVLDKEEEKIIVYRLLLMSEVGFLMTCTEVRHLIKAYQDGLGKTTRFVGNLPGPDFVKGFMKRHPTLTIGTTSMNKRARAVVSSEVIEDFFKSFAKTADICNYDESGLKDNPGVDMAIFTK
jgi:transposase-like protein